MKALLLAACLFFSFHNEKKFIPPGTLQISDSLYFDKEEVTCLAWIEYQLWTSNMYGPTSVQYLATVIDTTNWDTLSTAKIWKSSEPLTIEQRNLPVAGLTYTQALAFCKWRTERVKYFLSVRKQKLAFDFEYRLPTEKEWEFVSDGSGSVFSKANANLQMAQIKSDTRAALSATTVSSFKKNFLGLSDITGNVAEMTNEEHIAKGGSWAHTLEECRNGKQQIYRKAAPWLGFRCVCVVKKKF